MARSLTVLTLNIAHGARSPFPAGLLPRRYLRANVKAIVALLKAADADVVALQEVDRASFWSGGLDHLTLLGEGAGYPHRLHGEHRRVDRGPLKMNVGAALLSRLPFLETKVHRYGVGVPDDKGYVLGRVDVGGRQVGVVSTHLGLSVASRIAMFEQLAAHGIGQGHEVLAGDLNCEWKDAQASVRQLAQLLGMVPTDPEAGEPTFGDRRRIDWILAPPHLRISKLQVLPERVSDHRAVLATIVLD